MLCIGLVCNASNACASNILRVTAGNPARIPLPSLQREESRTARGTNVVLNGEYVPCKQLAYYYNGRDNSERKRLALFRIWQRQGGGEGGLEFVGRHYYLKKKRERFLFVEVPFVFTNTGRRRRAHSA